MSVLTSWCRRARYPAAPAPPPTHRISVGAQSVLRRAQNIWKISLIYFYAGRRVDCQTTQGFLAHNVFLSFFLFFVLPTSLFIYLFYFFFPLPLAMFCLEMKWKEPSRGRNWSSGGREKERKWLTGNYCSGYFTVYCCFFIICFT